MISLARKLLARAGIEVHRSRARPDPFRDQQRLCPEARIIFDVGANVGDVSLIYRRLFPTADIYAFEPHPETARGLRTRVDVRVVEAALSNAPGSALFHSNQNPATNSLFSTTEEGRSFYQPGIYREVGTLRVPTTTIDEFSASHGIERIDILKMDIQGAELLALKGAQEMLRTVSLVYTEVEFAEVYEGQALFGDIFRFLDSRGFSLYSLYGFYFSPAGQLVHADALFTLGGPRPDGVDL